MALESWELIILQLALGSLISGFILFVFAIFVAGMSFGDSDADVTVDTEMDIGMDVDVDAGLDLDIGHVDVDSGDIGSGHDSAHILNDNTPAPIILLMSTFFLMFGTIGYPLYSAETFTPILRLIITLVLPIFFVKLVSYIWKKYLSKEFSYEVPKVKIDNQVKTLTRIDEKGGMVLADTGDIDRAEEILHIAGSIKMQARTLPGVEIERNEIAYVIAIEPNETLIIDTWPKSSNKT